MKYFKLVVIGMMLFFSNGTKAQVSVNVNIGSPPMWGPVGYTEVRYYYLPDVEAYYDVHSSMFIYFGDGAWIHRAYLPTYYRNYDLYAGYKVVINDYRGNAPYTFFNTHKVKYKKGYRGSAQKTIGQKPGKGNSKSVPNKNVNQSNDRNAAHGNGGGAKKSPVNSNPGNHGNNGSGGSNGKSNGKKH